MKKTAIYLASLILMITMLVFPFSPALHAEETATSNLIAIKSYDDYVQYLKDNRLILSKDELENTKRRYLYASNTQDIAPSAAISYSTTNVQVQGVDEGDVLKNDARYIYKIMPKGSIAILDTQPSLKFLTELSLPNLSFSSLFLDSHYLIAIGRKNASYPSIAGSIVIPDNIASHKYFTTICIYDLSTPSAPKLSRQIELEGRMSDIRKLGSRLYVITENMLLPLAEDSYQKSDILPSYSDSADGGGSHLISFNSFYRPGWRPNATYYGLTYSLLTCIDLSHKTAISPLCLMADAEQVYMSQNALYLADNAYPSTYISRFNVSNSALKYAGTGEIPGSLYNQFAMDEYKGYFRAASNGSDNNTGDRQSMITIFDSAMHQVGFLNGLAPKETIYCARFEADKCYLITYYRKDPLFVIDLSQPEKPAALGQLKIPGVSYYLHPVGKNLMVGIGLNGDEDDNNPNKGLKLSLYDVSDPLLPKEVDHLIVGSCNSTSPALWQHTAVTVLTDKNLLAIPVSLQFESERNLPPFQGAYVFGVENGHLLAKAKLGHVDDKSTSLPYYSYYSNSSDRVCFIGSKLYFLYGNKVNAYELSNFHRIQTLSLPQA